MKKEVGASALRFIGSVVVALAGLLAPACCTSNPADPPREYNLGSPRQTTRYFLWAWADREHRVRHIYNCLSRGLIERHDLSPSKLELGLDQLADEVVAKLGDVDRLEIVDERPIGGSGRRRAVDFRSGTRSATVIFELDTSYEIRPMSQRAEFVEGDLESIGDVVRYEGGATHVRLPGARPPFAPDGIHRITVWNSWKIDQVVDADPELEQMLDQDAERARP